MAIRQVLVLSLLALVGCASTPQEDPVAIKLNDLDRRLERLEGVLSNQSLLDLAQQIQSLQAELRSMRGDLEELQHATDTAKNQQRDLYTDFDRRIQALEKTVVAPAASDASGMSPLPVPAGSDRANYQAAFDLLKNGQYEKATASLQRFLATFPDSALADNAQYWLGESYYVTKNYSDALKAFRRVVDKYPSSRKLPDAWLKIGYCQYELQALRPAREALDKVKRDFPDSSAAAEAAKRLQKIAAEGH
jgi:tol-pal system protein YbgF